MIIAAAPAGGASLLDPRAGRTGYARPWNGAVPVHGTHLGNG